jgi:hypothetical protein
MEGEHMRPYDVAKAMGGGLLVDDHRNFDRCFSVG